jgi:hypothetical protein
MIVGISEASNWLLRWATVIGSIVSLALSAALVLLYYQQKEILREQQKLTESEQKAVLRVEEYEMFRGSDIAMQMVREGHSVENTSEQFIHSDILVLTISNFGKSAVEELRPIVEIKEVDSEEWSALSVMIALSKDMVITDQMAFNQETDVIGMNERERVFFGYLTVELEDIPRGWIPEDMEIDHKLAMSEVLYLAGEAGVEEVKITLSLNYQDATGERDPITIASTKINPSQYNSIGQAFHRGQPAFP